MSAEKCVAMILAGGRGERLGSLTNYYSKPVVYFGGNHRIIDFTLNNCKRSGIDNIGILSRHHANDLHNYIDDAYGYKSPHGRIYTLPPQDNENSYKGTADAVYKNIEFIDKFNPEYVLVLAGDHIYNMNYKKMIAFHKQTNADITVASTPVSIKEASRFGIINASETGRVYGFEEKPAIPKSTLASMGIYVFSWNKLKEYLLADNANSQTMHDFGKDILPQMLHADELMYTYKFKGYWRDVGTVESLWEANMEQLEDSSLLQLSEDKWNTHRPHLSAVPNIMSSEAAVNRSIVSGSCTICGKVERSVLGASVRIGRGSEIVNSVVMPGVYIGDNVRIHNAVIGIGAKIMDNAIIGTDNGSDLYIDHKICSKGVSLIAPWMRISKGMRFQKNSHIHVEKLSRMNNNINAKENLNLYQLSNRPSVYHAV